MTNNDIRVLVVDDHAVVREGIRSVLERQPGRQLLDPVHEQPLVAGAVTALVAGVTSAVAQRLDLVAEAHRLGVGQRLALGVR